MYKYILGLFIFFCGFQLKAQEVLSLENVIEIGLKNNYDIVIANNNIVEADNNITLGNAGFLPTLDIEGNYARNNNLRFKGVVSRERGDSSFVLRNVESSNYGIDAVFNWQFFDGTKMFITYEKLEDLREKARWDAKVVVEATLSSILSAYFNIINQKSALSILEGTLKLSQERLKIAKDKYELGSFSKAEYLSAQVDYNEDQSALIAQKGILNDAKVQLNVLIAREASQQFSVADSVIKIDGFFEINELRDKVKAENYELAASKIAIQIAEREKQEIRSELLPVLALNANTGIGGSANPVGFLRSTETTSFNYALTASWRIFDGFNKNRRIQNAIINEENQQVTLVQLRQQLLGELETQYVRYENRLALIRLEVRNVEVAKENADLALERFKVGRSNSLALREAQLNAVEAAGRLLNALYEAKIAEIEILRISGSTITDG